MLSELLLKPELFVVVRKIDDDLAERVREQGCRYCGSKLCRGDYERKPRGGPKLFEGCEIRRSFCCGNESCRRRTKPPSVMFFGRRVYWGCVILVVLSLRRGGAEGWSTGQLMRRFGVSRQTIKRWAKYFAEEFPKSGVWKRVRGRVIGSVSSQELPGALLKWCCVNQGSESAAVVNCLKLISEGAT